LPRTPDDERADLRASDLAPGPKRRLFADGEHWLVREIPAPAFDRRARTHLVFESGSVMRRVRQFPADWDKLSDEALYALSVNLQTSRK